MHTIQYNSKESTAVVSLLMDRISIIDHLLKEAGNLYNPCGDLKKVENELKEERKNLNSFLYKMI